jgi:glutamate carboxypeptidase
MAAGTADHRLVADVYQVLRYGHWQAAPGLIAGDPSKASGQVRPGVSPWTFLELVPRRRPITLATDQEVGILFGWIKVMNELSLAALPFDPEDILSGLKTWVECESPTFDAAAVNRMMDVASRQLVLIGACLDRIPGRMGFGDCVRARFAHPRTAEPGVLILGHLDTVHPVGTLDQFSWRREGNRCFGPGILDMKGGNYLALEAIRHLQQASWPTPLPITVLFTSDEEAGSPSTRDLIEAEAARHKYVLVPEAGRRDGGVVTGRYPVARFNLAAIGQPSHAGLRLSEGHSAIREMAMQILAIEEMTTEESTFSVGVVQGGKWVNCVATICRAEVLNVSKNETALGRSRDRILALRSANPNVSLVVEPSVTRPFWTTSDKDWTLYAEASAIAQQLGFEIPHQYSAGGSDANFTGAMGVATLDGLGPRGDRPHTLEEHLIVESLPERGRLLAGLLVALK